jgi:hypothetical protein
MRGRTYLYALVAVCLPTAARGALVVDPPRPITHSVTVQLIQTAFDNGSSPATVFGDVAQRAIVEASVDTIWAQAGIQVNFLPEVKRYDSSFAYLGSVSPRPSDDFDRIFANATIAGGILDPDPTVINIFFVKVVPGSIQLPENWVKGLANTGTNGIVQFIGNQASTDHVAHWVSHEIAHNLGLLHTADGIGNLMEPTRRISSQLTQAQISAIFQTTWRSDGIAQIPVGGTHFLKMLPTLVEGDFNRNGTVDLADYTFWRDSLGSTTNLLADGNSNGRIDTDDYNIWKANFGATVAVTLPTSATIPEPINAVSLAWVLAAFLSKRWPRVKT